MIWLELKQEGFALLAMALALALVALVAFGSSFFWLPGKNTGLNPGAVDQELKELKGLNDSRNAALMGLIGDGRSTTTGTKDASTNE
jgi:hypothetical protein